MNVKAEDGNRFLIFFVLGHSLPKSLPEVQKHGRWEGKASDSIFDIQKKHIHMYKKV